MKAPNGPLILIVFCGLILALCWVVITTLTTPTRAIASGVALAATAGVFIWFAATNRFAIARGVIALGATAVAAPLAAIQAATNDFLFSAFANENPTPIWLEEFDEVMALGWTMSGVGAVIGLILIIVGGVMHRAPR
ncbi:hypothetical protein A8B78_00920 [Jannaschia sp. EhC01]|nr:hypothetical protein A8B78_00920 [Jannaschia sp. EhC01]